MEKSKESFIKKEKNILIYIYIFTILYKLQCIYYGIFTKIADDAGATVRSVVLRLNGRGFGRGLNMAGITFGRKRVTEVELDTIRRPIAITILATGWLWLRIRGTVVSPVITRVTVKMATKMFTFLVSLKSVRLIFRIRMAKYSMQIRKMRR